MLTRSRALLLCFVFASVSACDCGGTRGGGGGGGDSDVDTGETGGSCTEGDVQCNGLEVLSCEAGQLVSVGECQDPQICVFGVGCRNCFPGQRYCQDGDVYECGPDGQAANVLQDCGDNACVSGLCMDACGAATLERSNLGCDYFAVDLDNEYGSILGMRLDSRGEQFAVVLANPSDATVGVDVFQSDGAVGAPIEALVQQTTVPPNGLVRIDLPNREVDGSNGVGEGTASALTPNAYRIRTDFPVVAYQFNPIVEDASNDASLLIPVPALDLQYRVTGWPTANPIEIPIGGMDIEGIPDHSYVTIVGTEPGTVVTVTLGGPIIGGGGVSAASAGDVLEFPLSAYDVLNLESTGVPGDMSGTIVRSNKPVAVFSGGERGLAPIDTTGVSAHPSGEPDDWCCTEHLEEQVFPTTSWGKRFVVTRSAPRSAHPTWKEPDIYRVMADRDGTTVTTNLGSPNSFTIDANEFFEFSTDRSFTLDSNQPISVSQILVSQGWVVDWKPGHGGDPSLLLFPPFEQYRQDYIVLVPNTFSANYVVISAPVGTGVTLDGVPVPGTCTREAAGSLDGTEYEAITCPVGGGAHTIFGDVPVGVAVYGYHSVGSYAYAGGADLEQINPLE